MLHGNPLENVFGIHPASFGNSSRKCPKPYDIRQGSIGNLMANSQRNLNPSDKTLAFDRGMPLPQVNGQSVLIHAVTVAKGGSGLLS
jgi:hypothetical protein